MSGSSLDGLDIVAVRFGEGEGLQWDLEATASISLPESIRDILADITNLKAIDILKIESSFSKFVGQSVLDFCNNKNISPDFISIHGHTVAHLPDNNASWQLLNGGMISAMTSYPVVCDFRNSDMAMGGQGTPMAILADRDLFPDYDYYINLGGIANISYFRDERWTAYDLFPFNQVFNYYAGSLGYDYDKGGQIAATGQIHTPLLNQLHVESYILKSGPKSIDNNWVKNYWIGRLSEYELTPADIMRTYIEFTTEHISRLVPQTSKILWSGGGVHNEYFMEVIRSKSVDATIPDPVIIDFKEAILIAYAGYLRMQGKKNFVSTATGASADTCGGAVYIV